VSVSNITTLPRPCSCHQQRPARLAAPYLCAAAPQLRQPCSGGGGASVLPRPWLLRRPPLLKRRLARRCVAAAARTRGVPHRARCQGGAVTREELGRCTWTLLHTLAAQYAEQPTKQQQRDARELVRAGARGRGAASHLAAQILILTRLYPCRECAVHFAELVRSVPARAATRRDSGGSLRHAQRGPAHCCDARRAVPVAVPHAQQGERAAGQACVQLRARRGALGPRHLQGRRLQQRGAAGRTR
jgi:hypothetical protein